MRKERVGKTALIAALKNAGLTSKDAETAYDTMLTTMLNSLKQGKIVALPGIGSLDMRTHAARVGTKPGTSERIEIPERQRIGLRSSKLS